MSTDNTSESVIDKIESTLSDRLAVESSDGLARRKALDVLAAAHRTATSLVAYQSAGDLLIIGPEPYARIQAESLAERLNCVVLAVEPSNGDQSQKDDENKSASKLVVLHAPLDDISGHLGQFMVTVAVNDKLVNLRELQGSPRAHFDLVLDLQRVPQIRSEVLPPGYLAPGRDADALYRAVAELPDLVGEFEKPKYFDYNPDICAHGRSGLTGCTRCLDVCPTDAIASLGDLIEVDPYRCQGAGSCATACPTGAIGYAFPPAADLLDGLRRTLSSYLDAGGKQPCVLFHDAEAGKELLSGLVARLPENILPCEVEEIGSVGMETWLSSLAYGSARVALLITPQTPSGVIAEIKAQLSFSWAILEAMGYSQDHLLLVGPGDESELLDTLKFQSVSGLASPARYAGLREKRKVLSLAVENLLAQASLSPDFIGLPVGAPFGSVQFNHERCTLCMACVSQCPATALVAGDETPMLRFVEDNCVQCGLCRQACPEDAIDPYPRYLFDVVARAKPLTLKEELPFHCVTCGKAFATQSVIERMIDRLKDHHMFQGDGLKRLQMCEDCRVKDMFVAERDQMGKH